MNWHSILGITSTLAIFLPVIVIVALRLFTFNTFLALMVYYLFAGAYNLIAQQLIPSTPEIKNALGVINNLLDAPLMLYFLTAFATTPLLKKQIKTAILVFILFEIIILLVSGFTKNTVKIVLGPDIAIILPLSFIFFIRNVRLAITNPKSLGKAVMISAVLLAYSIFSLIYLFYYILETKYVRDTQLVYYIVTLLSALLMTVGIAIENKRIKRLQELKTTRRELAVIYGKANPVDLDREGRFFGIFRKA